MVFMKGSKLIFLLLISTGADTNTIFCGFYFFIMLCYFIHTTLLFIIHLYVSNSFSFLVYTCIHLYACMCMLLLGYSQASGKQITNSMFVLKSYSYCASL